MPTATVTAVSSSNILEPSGKDAVTDTVAAFAPSATVVGAPALSPLASTLRVMEVGPASLSVMETSAPVTVSNPSASVVPDTVIASVPSATSSSATARLKVADPLVCPAAIVTSKSSTAVKSSASACPAPPSPDTDTDTTVSSGNNLDPSGKAAVTLTVLSMEPSSTAVGAPSPSPLASTLKTMAVGATSLSLMKTSASLTANVPEDPNTVTRSEPSATLSSAAVKVNDPDPREAPAAIVIVKSSTSV